ncbi:MAG TPA: ornithine carbamoyltransferase [Candidatus Nanopelagicales bacterium]
MTTSDQPAAGTLPHSRHVDLRGRDFLREADFSAAELDALISLAAQLKAERAAGAERQRLVGRVLALIFEKTSTRTRCAFEVAAFHQGAHTTFLDPSSSQLGHKETAADTGAVLAGMYDAIQFRGAAQATVEELAAGADVPVYNGLTDDWHPTQMLADFLTMQEVSGGAPWAELSLAYVGDARYNMGNSMLMMGAIMGSDVRIVAPRALWPSRAVQELARERAAASGARLLLTEDVAEGVAGAGFVHTDVWVSMGEPKAVWDERVAMLRPYRVDAAMLAATGRADASFMHCLPAYHDARTTVGREAAERFGLHDGVEVTDEVFSSPASVVFRQAHNRMHTIKALLVATLTG